MFKIVHVILLMWISTAAFAQTGSITNICERFNDLNTAICDNKLKKTEAIAQFRGLIIELKAATNHTEHKNWVLPLRGYNYHGIGGYKGNGYIDKGYSYFDWNKHLAHPAHDIFISDRNQDCLDDKTRQPVDVLAVDDGIVIACCHEWDTQSDLRGGKYIWIYHPVQNILTYYAHNSKLLVSPGTLVTQGEKIAEVGRSGYNAYKKRSPTHLHFSAYHLVNNLPVAYNSYEQLIKSTSK